MNIINDVSKLKKNELYLIKFDTSKITTKVNKNYFGDGLDWLFIYNTQDYSNRICDDYRFFGLKIALEVKELLADERLLNDVGQELHVSKPSNSNKRFIYEENEDILSNSCNRIASFNNTHWGIIYGLNHMPKEAIEKEYKRFYEVNQFIKTIDARLSNA
jgi:hypothetical protein